MLSRTAALSARVLRARSSGSQQTPCFRSAVQFFHAGAPDREQAAVKPAEETKPVSEMSNRERDEYYRNLPLFVGPRISKFVTFFKFHDPKFLLGYGFFFGVPAIASGMFPVNEEALLLGPFVLFTATLVDIVGKDLAKNLDEEADAILREHNVLEDIEINDVAEKLAVERHAMSSLVETKNTFKLAKYCENLRREAEIYQKRHERRDGHVKMLEALRSARLKRLTALRKQEVDEAIEKVVTQVKTDKKLKKAALDNALAALSDPSAASKADPVSKAFSDYWKQKATETEKNKEKTYTLSEEEYQDEVADLKNALSRLGDGAQNILGDIPKQRKLDSPSLFY